MKEKVPGPGFFFFSLPLRVFVDMRKQRGRLDRGREGLTRVLILYEVGVLGMDWALFVLIKIFNRLVHLQPCYGLLLSLNCDLFYFILTTMMLLS